MKKYFQILEFKQCSALICPRCTGYLLRAIDFKNSILENNKHFNELYKIYRFEEYDIDYTLESSQWSVEDMEVKKEPDFTLNNHLENYQVETEEFLITEVIRDESGNFANQATNPIAITSEVKEEPEEIHEINFSGLCQELNFKLDSNNSEDLDNCDNYLDEISQSTSQYSSEWDRQEHPKKRKPLSFSQLERKRERDRLRKQEKRLNETEEERAARKQANAARQRRRREEMKQYHLENKVRVQIKRSNETDEQRQRRLERERLRMAEKRRTESKEQRRRRLELEKIRVAQKRNNESEEERQKRLEVQRIRVAQKRSAQKAERNQIDLINVKLIS